MEKQNSVSEETFTLKEYLNGMNKEILAIAKIDENKKIKCCSYSNGYITQEILSCETCFKEKGVKAAICIGCAFECHKDHEINHLYFKRKIRCDCGNSKFGMINYNKR